jgi:small subunit ribosomal protein S6
MTSNFEVTYILRPSLDNAQVNEQSKAIAELVRTGGGEIVGDINHIGKRTLAYEIDDVREGYYITMTFTAPTEQKKALEHQLRLNESVLRSLVIRLDE